jgi:hypothetical protein
MSSEGDNEGGGENGGNTIIKVPPRRVIPHYHGDEVRVLFVVSAVVLVVAQSTGAELPLTTFESVASAVVLVVAAGITNPAQFGIHWLNAFLAMAGTLLFGTTAVEHYRSGLTIFDPSFVYVEALAILSLIALYYTTRTIRGIKQRQRF